MLESSSSSSGGCQWCSWFTKPVGKRQHLVELHETEWCPPFVRAAIVENLQFGWSALPLPAFAMAHTVKSKVLTVAKAMRSTTSSSNFRKGANGCCGAVATTSSTPVVVVDMCSGGGGPMPFALGCDKKTSSKNDQQEVDGDDVSVAAVILTDLFPQPQLWQPHTRGRANIFYCPLSTDAAKMDITAVIAAARTDEHRHAPPPAIKELLAHTQQQHQQQQQQCLAESPTPNKSASAAAAVVVRTICGALHHFQPPEVEKMLADAVRCRHGVLFVEALERSVAQLALFTVLGPLVALAAPLILLALRFGSPASAQAKAEAGPFYASLCRRVLATYLIPVIPVVMLMDALVSCVRVYSDAEFFAIVERVDPGQHQYDWKIERCTGPAGIGLLVVYTGTPRN